MRKLILISLLFISALSFSQGLKPGITASAGSSADVVAPLFSSAELGTYSDSIVLVLLSEAADRDSIPPSSAVTVTGGVTTIGIDTIWMGVTTDSLFIGLDSTLTIFNDSTFLVDYTPPVGIYGTNGKLQDIAENKVAAWVDSTVTNNLAGYISILYDENLTVGYEADVVNYTTSGDTVVTQWDDMSGNDYHLVRSVEAQKPHYAGDSITFDGVDDFLLYTLAATLDQPITVYAVVKKETHNNNERILYFGSITPVIATGTAANSLRMQGDVSWIDNTDYVSPEWSIITAVFNGASSTFQVNDNSPDTNNIGTKGFDVINLTDGQANVSFKAIYVRSVDESVEDIATVIAGLNGKYSIY